MTPLNGSLCLDEILRTSVLFMVVAARPGIRLPLGYFYPCRHNLHLRNISHSNNLSK